MTFTTEEEKKIEAAGFKPAPCGAHFGACAFHPVGFVQKVETAAGPSWFFVEYLQPEIEYDSLDELLEDQSKLVTSC